MPANQRASVVIVNWNGRQYLEQCLLSVLRQTYTDCEVILVDNASTDGSVELVEREFPEVELIRNSVNRGFAAGNNDGIRAATGAYIATLNNDAFPESTWLDELIGAIRDDSNVGMGASKMLFYHFPDTINSTGISLDWAGIAWDRLGGQRDDRAQTTPVEVFGPCAGAAVYKREMIEDIGLFDEDFFMYLEDVDLAWRGRLRGWRCLYVPTAEVRHVHSASSVEGSAFKNYLLGRNKIWTMVKNYPTPTFLFFIPAILFYDLMSLQYSVLVRGNVVSLRGRIEAVRQMGAILRKRAEIQRGRRVSSTSLLRVTEKLRSPVTLFQQYRHLEKLVRERESSHHTTS